MYFENNLTNANLRYGNQRFDRYRFAILVIKNMAKNLVPALGNSNIQISRILLHPITIFERMQPKDFFRINAQFYLNEESVKCV